ncbi:MULTISPECIES: hypothetical protein [Niastella]|uniref:Uncharacterized protein n=1 Tax=Niastella soli TaxID=2821487 RepID=A0ABS3Z390_9BACT|nr:hypothetical protein [Niastella soli]MBO9204632.1 hypothetical protein [Niastella soli]
MLKIVQVGPTYFSDIKVPTVPMLRENNIVDIDIAVIPKKYNAPPRDRQRIMVMVNYDFKVFLDKNPFQVASAGCDFDIFTDRDLHLMELYRMAVSVAVSLKKHVFSQNLPFLQDEDFPLDAPDVIRQKLLPELQRINDSKTLSKTNLN